MREIKLRTWDTKYKAFKYLVLTGKPFVSKELIIASNNLRLAEECSEWMQYTGLKDQDGKEIYEGDIVLAQSNINSGSCHPTEGKGVVLFNKKMASFMIKIYNNTNFKLKLFDTCTYLEGLNIDCEVIGNIYENPELLKEENK